MSDLDDLEDEFSVGNYAGPGLGFRRMTSRIARNVRTKERVTFGRQGLNPNRGIAPRATHCAAGHEMTEANTFINNKGTPICRECKRAYERAAYARRMALKRDKSTA